MTKKQIAALQRILEREAAEHRMRPDRPSPGQHPCGGKYAVTDGMICVLMDAPEPTLPLGEQADTFAEIVHKERKSEAHYPVPADQINVSKWRTQAKRRNEQSQRVKLSTSILPPEKLRIDDLEATGAPTVIEGQFNPQLLVDAVEAVGGDSLLFLGYGRFNKRFPSLLVMPPEWTEINCSDPIALVLSLRV